jgi:hypothetical protein
MFFCKVFCIAFVSIGTMLGSTIISVAGAAVSTGGLILDPEQSLVASWTASGAYTDVTISVNLLGPPGDYSGTAYLTDAIGSGTSLVDQIGAAPFNVDITTTPPFQRTVVVFSGLSLDAGTFYLTLSSGASASSGFAWSVASPSSTTITTGAGVTRNTDLSSFGNTQDAYSPASGFSTPPFDTYDPLEFTVTGTPTASSVPEPSSFVPVALLLAFISCTGAGRKRIKGAPTSAS